MKVYRWEWPDKDFFVEVVAWSREEAIQVLKKEEGWTSSELISGIYSERKFEGGNPYIDWGSILEKKKEEGFEFHRCTHCDINYEVKGQIIETDMEGIYEVISFDNRCPRCKGYGTGTILKFVEDCPVCQYAWEVEVFREVSGSLYLSAECECCGNRMSERTAMDDTDRLIDKWEFITTHIMIERAGEY